MVQRDVHPDFFLLLPDLFFCYQIYSSATRFILLLPVARDLDCISEKERMGGVGDGWDVRLFFDV